ncbi:aspartic peptidase domain-containing protein [Pholiota molesta]|nr:aspartic peptidase domain-containing protein [Pholiota molesta]
MVRLIVALNPLLLAFFLLRLILFTYLSNVAQEPQSLGVILDTGSSDLWFVGTSCLCSQVVTFQPSHSSSFKGGTPSPASDIEIQYGSGSVTGSLSQDTVSMGGFTVPSQSFLNIDTITGIILSDDPLGASGLMGLAFATLARTRATPFWEALATSNQLSSPEMAFWLARSQNLQVEDVPGGAFTLGGTNSSLFTGDIEFLNMPTGTPEFWTLPLASVSVNGKKVSIGSAGSMAAIDTGTSLIAGPIADVTAIWATIPGSGPSESGAGFFNFPCATTVQVSISFGGKSWPINPADMIAGTEPTDFSKCIGSIFAVNILLIRQIPVGSLAILSWKTCIPSSEPPHHQSASRSFPVWRKQVQELEFINTIDPGVSTIFTRIHLPIHLQR